MSVIKPIAVGLLLLASPTLVNVVADGAGKLVGVASVQCKFGEEQMKQVKEKFPDKDISEIEANLLGKTCEEALDWINSQWQGMHDAAQ